MRNLLVMLTMAVLLVTGCKKSEDSPVTPPTNPGTEDWSYPANATKFSVTLYAKKTTVAVGEAFDMRLVCYNLTSVFGTAVEISYDPNLVDVTDALLGPYAPSDTTLIAVHNIEPTPGRASVGITFRAGSGKTMSGSGVLFKLQCKAKAAGSAAFTINAAKLSIKQSDGTVIPNFGLLQVENGTVTVQ